VGECLREEGEKRGEILREGLKEKKEKISKK